MKILLLTHNPVCTYNNMGKTLLSLFSEFGKEELCQLYIQPTTPDTNTCKSYYQITDKQVLKSLMTFKIPGKIVTQESIEDFIIYINNNPSSSFIPKRGSSSAVSRLARDFMWKISRWNSKNLKSWLDFEAPDCIFLAPGYAKFIYDLALRISVDRNIPIISYICDDYYFVNTPDTLLDCYQLYSLKKKIDKSMKKTDKLIAISEGIKNTYGQHFNLDSRVIMTGSNLSVNSKKTLKSTISDLYYFGNVGANRYISLIDIGVVLSEINIENNSNIKLRIYTAESDKSILEKLNNIDSIHVFGFVSGQEYENIFSNADMLVHIEAFDEQSIDLVKFSVSTKIADALASGIPLLAYGPESVSSIQHLVSNNCALTATDKKQLKEVLVNGLFNKSVRENVVNNAIITANRFHNKANNSKMLKDIIAEVINERTAK